MGGDKIRTVYNPVQCWQHVVGHQQDKPLLNSLGKGTRQVTLNWVAVIIQVKARDVKPLSHSCGTT